MPPPCQTLILEQIGAVLKITVNRPEVRNAQSRVMLEEFDAALMGAADDETVRAVIVAGAGGIFRRDTVSAARRSSLTAKTSTGRLCPAKRSLSPSPKRKS